MIDLAEYTYPKGLHLLKSWQAGSNEAKAEIKSVFDAAIAGDFDDNFSILAPADEVHATASVHMLALAILHDLYGVNSAEYYKTCLLYTSPSPRDLSTSRMPSSA